MDYFYYGGPILDVRHWAVDPEASYLDQNN